MHSLYSSIICILNSEFELCVMQMDGRGARSVRPPGRGTAALSHRRGSRGPRGRGRSAGLASRGGRFEMAGGIMTVPPPSQPPPPPPRQPPPPLPSQATPTTTQSDTVLDRRRSKQRHDPLLIRSSASQPDAATPSPRLSPSGPQVYI